MPLATRTVKPSAEIFDLANRARMARSRAAPEGADLAAGGAAGAGEVPCPSAALTANSSTAAVNGMNATPT